MTSSLRSPRGALTTVTGDHFFSSCPPAMSPPNSRSFSTGPDVFSQCGPAMSSCFANLAVAEVEAGKGYRFSVATARHPAQMSPPRPSTPRPVSMRISFRPTAADGRWASAIENLLS